MRNSLLAMAVVGAVLALPDGGFAQDWAAAMFGHTSHDFGTVARGADCVHRFPLENIYLEDAHIASVRSSCGCTLPEVTKPFLKTYEQSEVIAKLDTRRFTGRKDSTLTVVFDKPFPAEVQLHVYAFIRCDVVVQPGQARFESVEQGTAATQNLTVSYAGRDDWKIVDVRANRPCLEAVAVEQSRNQGQVTYELQVTLNTDAPAGYLRDQLILVTNDRDPNTSQVPVPVEAVVVPGIQVRPNPLTLGILKPGQTVTRNLVVQAKQPFRVLEATGPDERFRFKLPDRPSVVQLVPVTFTAEASAGSVAGTIQLRTDLAKQSSLEVSVNGQVVAPTVPTKDAPGAAEGATPSPFPDLPQPADPAPAPPG